MILGINLNHDYALCLIEDGKFYLKEWERISRIRNHPGHDCLTLRILDDFSLEELRKVELICLNSPSMQKIRERKGNLSGESSRSYQYIGEYVTPNNENGYTQGILQIDKLIIPAIWVSHYHAHAASAYYTSPYMSADILCLDGGGDFGFGALFKGSGNSLNLVNRYWDWEYGISYHHLAQRYFQLKGFHEGKLMALAAYGDPSLCEPLLFEKNGRLDLDSIVTVHDVAKFQLEFEKAIIALLENTNSRHQNLSCAGGCFLNVSANSALAESGLYQNIFIPPYVGDMGTALGAALLGCLSINKPLPAREIIGSPFLGDDLGGGGLEFIDLVKSFGDTVEFVEPLNIQSTGE